MLLIGVWLWLTDRASPVCLAQTVLALQADLRAAHTSNSVQSLRLDAEHRKNQELNEKLSVVEAEKHKLLAARAPTKASRVA